MHEIFFDRPGVLFSDGDIVKFSLQSAHPTQRGETLEDVALLVCKTSAIPELIKILTDFMAHRAESKAAIPPRRDEPSVTNNDSSCSEESIRLGTMHVAHNH